MMPTGASALGADVERARKQKVDIGLFQLRLTRFFQAFDDRMLELELPDEAQAVAEPVCDEQHEAMEVEDAVAELRLVVVSPCSRTNPLPEDGACGCAAVWAATVLARTAATGPQMPPRPE